MKPYFKDGDRVWRKYNRPRGERQHVRMVRETIGAQRAADMRRQAIEETLMAEWDLEHAQMIIN